MTLNPLARLTMTSYFEPGDLVFFKSNGNLWDKLISLVSPNYYHVGVAISSSEFIDATVGGVKVTEYNPSWGADIYYHPKIHSKNVASRMNRLNKWSEKHLEDPYSYTQACLAGLLRTLKLKHMAEDVDPNWFCSEFAAYLISNALDIRLCPELVYSDILPDDLKQDLIKIED